jgi:hypothetical protein
MRIQILRLGDLIKQLIKQNLSERICTDPGLPNNCNRDTSTVGDNVMGDMYRHNSNTDIGQALKDMTTVIVDTIRQSNNVLEI